MDTATSIIDELTRITERAEAFRHGREDLFKEISLAEMHCIHWIGLTDHPNVTKLSARMRMTRGAISKIARRLIGKELIESYREPTNNKEIFYRLTQEGWRLHAEHATCHEQARQGRLAILQSFTPDEQQSILRFLGAVNGQLDAKIPPASGDDAEETI